MTFVWIAAIVIFGIAEAATAGLVSIWFVAGAVAALLVAPEGLDVARLSLSLWGERMTQKTFFFDMTRCSGCRSSSFWRSPSRR